MIPRAEAEARGLNTCRGLAFAVAFIACTVIAGCIAALFIHLT